MDEKVQEPVIRLIVDNEEKKIGPSIGITQQRSEQIYTEVIEIFRKHPKVSATFKEITETYYHPGEIAYALFTLGEIRTKSNCPLHNGGSILGILLGGPRPPDDDDDDDDNKH